MFSNKNKIAYYVTGCINISNVFSGDNIIDNVLKSNPKTVKALLKALNVDGKLQEGLLKKLELHLK